jgi:uncharacterized membrane protein (UPF0136 family)
MRSSNSSNNNLANNNAPQRQTNRGIWGFVKKYMIESLIAGFFLGVGHFIAFKILSQPMFSNLRSIAATSAKIAK